MTNEDIIEHLKTQRNEQISAAKKQIEIANTLGRLWRKELRLALSAAQAANTTRRQIEVFTGPVQYETAVIDVIVDDVGEPAIEHCSQYNWGM